MLKNFVAISAALTTLALGASAQAGSQTYTLTFDGAICGGAVCADGDSIDPLYGSVPGVSVVVYSSDVNNIGSTNHLYFWSGGYSDLTNVAYGDYGGTPGFAIITLIPNSTVTINSFDLGAWPNVDRQSQVIWYSAEGQFGGPGPITVSGTTASHFTPNLSSTFGVAVLFGPDGYNVGVDNITYTITTVPEPGSWALMLVGFGGLGAALRASRRKAVVA